MQSIYYRAADGTVDTDLTEDKLPALLQDKEGVLWLDLGEEPEDKCQKLLSEVFNFHPLAIEDAIAETHAPKVDDWETYLYLVMQVIQREDHTENLLTTVELDCFLGANYLVTYHAAPISALQQVWQTILTDTRATKHGASHALYVVFDVLTADYMRVLESFNDHLDDIEDEIFVKPSESLLNRIFSLKRATLRFRRILAPQREVLWRLARGNDGVIPDTERIYFRDIYDHLVRIHDITDGLRDLLSGALDMYLSVVSNRMNDVMKTLTVITTLFMPLSFLVGFFGMNFFQASELWPAWTSPVTFIMTLSALILSPILMYLWMRRRLSI